MKKTKLILIIIAIVVIVSGLIITNFDNIKVYFSNREWEIAGSLGKAELENHLACAGTSSNFLIVQNNSITGFDGSGKKCLDKTVNLKNATIDSDGDYAIIAEKDGTKVYVICENDIVWEKNIDNGTILYAYINKNGYSAVAYSQSGYKTLVKVFSNTGEELFTNYLVSAYALNIAISNDNKKLAISEIDTEGVIVKCKVKEIDMKSTSENNIKIHEIPEGDIVSNIEYSDKNLLLVMTDKGVVLFNEEEKTSIVAFKDTGAIMCSIQNRNNVFTINSNSDGLFNENVSLGIYDIKSHKNPEKIELDETPNKIISLNNIVALDFGNEIRFINTAGNLVKKCDYSGQIKQVMLYNDAKTAALIFRDYVEFVKIGGI